MPLLALAVALLAALTGLLLLMALSLVLRYRAGTARRPARGWAVTLNLIGLALSTGLFFTFAAAANLWIPSALAYSLLGLAGGGLAGFLGLWTSRWEHSPEGLWYTPNRWLVLALTLVVTGRLAFGLWRAWHAWGEAPAGSWLAESGAAGAMGAGALVLGYYLVYWAGVRARLRRPPAHQIP